MEDFGSKLRNLINSEVAVFFWLFAITVLCFGVLIPTLGFYWDDLPYLFQFSAFGPGGFPAYVASDRPFSAWIFSATTALFGYNPLGYHLLALLLRWASASLFYLILRGIWPQHKTENLVAASLFSTYPGFLQQPIALIYNHHFSVLAMFLTSVYLMVLNLKREKPRVITTIISVALTFSMFSIENFVMLELVRPFIIWKLSGQPTQSKRDRIRKSMMVWLPYLGVLVLFFVWRVVIFKFPTYKPAGVSGIFAAPFQAIGAILSRFPRDFYTVYLKAWAANLNLPTISDFGRAATYLFWAVSASMAGITVIFFSSLRPVQYEQNQKSSDSSAFRNELLIAILLTFLLAGSIVWALDLPVEIKFAWDRMTLAFIPGVSLLGAFIISFISKRKPIMVILLAVLFTLAASQNYQNGIAFKRDWDHLQDFLTQLAWRVPALADNTIFITSTPGLTFYSDNSLTAPINMQYSENLSSNELSHFVYSTNARTHDWFEEDNFDLDYRRGYRSFVFYGNTGNAIAYRFDPPACLQIMDRTYSNSITTPNLTDRQVKEIRFTNLDLILEEPAHLPFTPLFTASETGSWCYFFEKADLARQNGDYAEIVRLGDAARAAGKVPRVPTEWLPFLEGYLWEGKFDAVETIIAAIDKDEGNYTAGMCYTLRRIASDDHFPYHEAITALIEKHACEN